MKEPHHDALVAIGFLVVALTLVGCTDRNAPKGTEIKLAQDGDTGLVKVAQDGAKKKEIADDGKKEKKPADAKPDYTLTATEITKEFIADAKAAKAKFNDKIIQVTGPVEIVFQGHFHMQGAEIGKTMVNETLDCEVQPSEASKVHRFSLGQKVKVVGKGMDNFGSFKLAGCSVAELEPSKIVKVSAVEMTKVFDADRNVEAKYGDKGWLITGTVEDVKKNEAFAETYFVYLKGNQKTRLRLWVTSATGTDLPKVGQVAEFSGRRIRVDDAKNELEIASIFLSSK